MIENRVSLSLVLLIFEPSQRPILLSKFKKLTNATNGTIKGRVQITNLL